MTAGVVAVLPMNEQAANTPLIPANVNPHFQVIFTHKDHKDHTGSTFVAAILKIFSPINI